MKQSLVACGLLVATTVLASGSVAVQIKDAPGKFSQDEWDQIKPLFKLVEEAAAGKPAPMDLALTWHNDFLKTVTDVLLVPFTLKIEKGQFTSFPVAMYIRVVVAGAAAPAPGARDPLAQYPFEDAALFDRPKDGRFSRAFVAPPGDYDVYVALRERPSTSVVAPKTVVFKQPVRVPDLGPHLAASSIVIAEKIEVEQGKTRPNFEEQLDEPYRLWGTKITPALGTTFPQTGKLSVIFLIYNAGADANDKPDVEVQYDFYQRMDATEKFFGRTSPQSFNAETLRPEFSLAAGDVIIAGQDMPLARFPKGDYRLEISVVDRVTRNSLKRDVGFTVVGS